MAQVGEKGFFVEGPADEFGNRTTGDHAAVVEAEVYRQDLTGEVMLRIIAPPDFPWTGGSLHSRSWVPAEGPARIITVEERARLASAGGAAAVASRAE